MKHFGLIGYPLAHSFSKRYFEKKFDTEHITDTEYELYPLEHITGLPDLLHKHPNLCGLNITIPHKISILKYLDWINPDAKEVGAVNCIRISNESPVMAAFNGEVGVEGHDFRLEGFNTDIYGFQKSLEPLLQSHHQKALILGNGGGANAVKFVLGQLNIGYTIVARKHAEDSILFSELTREVMDEHKLIINTTPLGTSPNVDECPPIPYDYLTHEHLLYDVVYNPEVSLFLRQGLNKGTAIKKRLRNAGAAGRKIVGDMELQNHPSVRVACYSVLIAMMLSACGGDHDYSPKPRGYFRIRFPEKAYQTYNGGCPFSFAYPKYAKVEIDSMRNSRPCWLNVQFPEFKGTLHLSYEDLTSRKKLNELVEDAYLFASKQSIKATSIEGRPFAFPGRNVFGVYYDIDGNTASNAQFFVTDSTRHYMRGALYFKVEPKLDSIQPVLTFIKQDMDVMIKTLRWR